MADTLRFVDYDWSVTGGTSGNILLDINDGTNYCFDEISFPPPKPRHEWRDPAHGDGRDVSRFKYENRELTIFMHVYGTDEADLSTNARNLWAELDADNPILEWIAEGFTDPLYFDLVSPPISINPEGWFETSLRNSSQLEVIGNIELTLEAKPFLRAPETTIDFAVGLGLNDSFETRSGADFANWTEVQTNAGTVTADTTNYLDGIVAAKLTTTAGGTDVAGVTDSDYIAVDEDHHYCIKVFCYEISGAPTLDVDILCYDDAYNLLGTLTPLVAFNPAAATTWQDGVTIGGSPVIHPSSSGDAQKWYTGTAYVKRAIRNDAAAAGVITIDNVWFGDTEYISGNDYQGACGFVVPPGVCDGDIPAPLDLFIASAYAPGIWSYAVDPGDASYDVAALDSTHVWVTVDSVATGMVYFWNGTTWATQWLPVGDYDASGGIDVVDSTHVYCVAFETGTDDCDLLQYAGANWAKIADLGTSDSNEAEYTGCFSADSTHVWAVINNDSIYFWNNVAIATTDTTAGKYYCDVHGYDNAHVFAVGKAGYIKYWSGAAWAAQVSGTADDLYGVYSLDATHCWAVGENGTILFSADNGTNWTAQASGTTETLWGVYAADSTHIWACGANGTVLFSNGTAWTSQNATSTTWFGIDGISTTAVWLAGYNYIYKGVSTPANMALSNLIIGQRDLYSEDYSPVCEAPAEATIDYTRSKQKYLSAIAAGATTDYHFRVGDHRGRYLMSLGVTWAASTAYDKIDLSGHLETVGYTPVVDLTGTISQTQLDGGDPNTKWIEVALLSTRWVPWSLPTHKVPSDADENAINQTFTITAHASLATTQRLDEFTLIPIDRSYIELSSIAYNYLVLCSTDSTVFTSYDGTLETSALYPTGFSKGLPQFEADPFGVNMTMLAVKTVASDQRLTPLLNIRGRYKPLFLLVPED